VKWLLPEQPRDKQGQPLIGLIRFPFQPKSMASLLKKVHLDGDFAFKKPFGMERGFLDLVWPFHSLTTSGA
jgi:hypothetical protein